MQKISAITSFLLIYCGHRHRRHHHHHLHPYFWPGRAAYNHSGCNNTYKEMMYVGLGDESGWLKRKKTCTMDTGNKVLKAWGEAFGAGAG